MARSLWNSMPMLFAIWITYLATSSSNSNENYMRTRRIIGGSLPIGDEIVPKYPGEFLSISMPLLFFIIIA